MVERPLNICNACGWSWHPRGHDLSARCPECKSTNIDFAPDPPDPFLAFFEAIAEMFVWMFQAIGRLYHWCIWDLAAPVISATIEAIGVAFSCIYRVFITVMGWSLSVIDDIRQSDSRSVNPLALIGKILVIVVCAVVVVILSIRFCNWLLHYSLLGEE